MSAAEIVLILLAALLTSTSLLFAWLWWQRPTRLAWDELQPDHPRLTDTDTPLADEAEAYLRTHTQES